MFENIRIRLISGQSENNTCLFSLDSLPLPLISLFLTCPYIRDAIHFIHQPIRYFQRAFITHVSEFKSALFTALYLYYGSRFALLPSFFRMICNDKNTYLTISVELIINLSARFLSMMVFNKKVFFWKTFFSYYFIWDITKNIWCKQKLTPRVDSRKNTPFLSGTYDHICISW